METRWNLQEDTDIYISALASAPSRPPNPTLTPQNQASSKKKLVRKSQKLKKQGVLTVNIIPISQKSAKIAIFSCQKSRVPNEIETWINQNSVVTGIWTDPEKDKSLAVLFSEQSLVEKRYFSKIAVLYISALASAPSRPPNPTLTPQNQAS